MRDFALSNALGADDLRELVAWRHEAHRHPELSGEEEQTAGRVCAMLARAMPDRIISGLGGHGVAAIFDSGKQGPTIMFRSELDALPIEELGGVAHRSLDPGKAHLCGHDGHSAILLGLGKLLGRQRPERGRVVLMFQPAEEDGSGAAAVIADPRYGEIRPDYAFALHNMPGFPMGEAYLSEGPANCASRGVRIELTGSTAHASQPEAGRSPMRAVAELMPRLEEAGNGGQPRPGYALVTVTHASMGAASYGVAPGHAEPRGGRAQGDDRDHEEHEGDPREDHVGLGVHPFELRARSSGSAHEAEQPSHHRERQCGRHGKGEDGERRRRARVRAAGRA